MKKYNKQGVHSWRNMKKYNKQGVHSWKTKSNITKMHGQQHIKIDKKHIIFILLI